MADEIEKLEERLSACIAIEARGETYCLAFVCAFLARMLNFDRRALIGALEAEATRVRQGWDAHRSADSGRLQPATAADYGVGQLRALAACLRALAGPASGP